MPFAITAFKLIHILNSRYKMCYLLYNSLEYFPINEILSGDSFLSLLPWCCVSIFVQLFVVMCKFLYTNKLKHSTLTYNSKCLQNRYVLCVNVSHLTLCFHMWRASFCSCLLPSCFCEIECSCPLMFWFIGINTVSFHCFVNPIL